MEANTIGNRENKNMGGYYFLELRPDVRSPKGQGEQAPLLEVHILLEEKDTRSKSNTKTRSQCQDRRQDAKAEIVKVASSKRVDWFHFCRERKADIQDRNKLSVLLG